MEACSSNTGACVIWLRAASKEICKKDTWDSDCCAFVASRMWEGLAEGVSEAVVLVMGYPRPSGFMLAPRMCGKELSCQPLSSSCSQERRPYTSAHSSTGAPQPHPKSLSHPTRSTTPWSIQEEASGGCLRFQLKVHWDLLKELYLGHWSP